MHLLNKCLSHPHFHITDHEENLPLVNKFLICTYKYCIFQYRFYCVQRLHFFIPLVLEMYMLQGAEDIPGIHNGVTTVTVIG